MEDNSLIPDDPASSNNKLPHLGQNCKDDDDFDEKALAVEDDFISSFTVIL